MNLAFLLIFSVLNVVAESRVYQQFGVFPRNHDEVVNKRELLERASKKADIQKIATFLEDYKQELSTRQICETSTPCDVATNACVMKSTSRNSGSCECNENCKPFLNSNNETDCMPDINYIIELLKNIAGRG